METEFLWSIIILVPIITSAMLAAFAKGLDLELLLLDRSIIAFLVGW